MNCHIEELNVRFQDGSHIVYVNGSYNGNDPIGKLIHDFKCKISKDMYYKELAESVKHFKEEGGRSICREGPYRDLRAAKRPPRLPCALAAYHAAFPGRYAEDLR